MQITKSDRGGGIKGETSWKVGNKGPESEVTDSSDILKVILTA